MRIPRRSAALAIGLALLTGGCAAPGSDEPGAWNAESSRPASAATPLAEEEASYESLHFAVLGDFGTGDDKQLGVADRMCRWRRNHPFDLVITTGDNIYDEGHPDRFDEALFDPYDCLLSDGVRFRSTLGNHDIITNNGLPELNEPAFGLKARNYIVRKGGVRFVMADSNRVRWGWLDNHLPAQSGDRWTIVVFHHPVFSSGVHGETPGLRPWMPRLFRKHGVDLVFNGHEHMYEATKKLKGIRYVITGGGGAELRPCGEDGWFTAKCRSRHHFLYVRAGRDRLKVKAVPLRGEPFHVFRTSGRDPA